MRRIPWTTLALVLLVGEGCKTPGRAEAPQPALAPGRIETTDAIEANFHKLLEQGRTVFRQLTTEENLRVSLHPGADIEEAYALFPELLQRRAVKAPLGSRAA